VVERADDARFPSATVAACEAGDPALAKAERGRTRLGDDDHIFFVFAIGDDRSPVQLAVEIDRGDLDDADFRKPGARLGAVMTSGAAFNCPLEGIF